MFTWIYRSAPPLILLISKADNWQSRLLVGVTVLLLSALGNRAAWADQTLFDEDYQNCPASLRLAHAITDLQVSRPPEDYEMQVAWNGSDPATWNLQDFEAAITLIVGGGEDPIVREVPLGTRLVLFDKIDLARELTVQVAVTNDGYVISDVLEVSFISGMNRPRFSSPFYWQGHDHYEGDLSQPVGTFYYLGFNRTFDNWYAEAQGSSKFRIGLRHGLARPVEGEFRRYRLQVVDDNGDDVLGYIPGTVTSPLYENTVLALGDFRATDTQPTDRQVFSNIHKSNRFDVSVLAAHELGSAVSYYWDNIVVGSYPQLSNTPDNTDLRSDRLSFVDLADVDTRQLYALPPHHFFSLPKDIFAWDGQYVITAWAENEQGHRISDRSSVTFNVLNTLRSHDLYINLAPLESHQLLSRRTQPPPSGNNRYVVYRKTSTFPADHAILTDANSPDEVRYLGSTVTTWQLPVFYSELDSSDLREYRVYRRVSNTWQAVTLSRNASDGNLYPTNTGDNRALFAPVISKLRNKAYGSDWRPAGETVVLRLFLLEESQ